ncbi:ADAMTS-like protein 1 isoform X1 [Tachysurus fulvidraco]|uniref:ADAMTS-like protein 1 isoform X1 n=2 Tax=Tachysurus fulvidraco TaxID=1234273 RepID=UPI001FEE144D|nr:ADAMTS-like protein 1 isoform X1 [Tachysurus fulvidraco]
MSASAGRLFICSLLLFKVWVYASDGEAVFIREFTLRRRDELPDDFLNEGPVSHKSEDSNSRTARSEEDRDTLWDAWGTWSECSRTCGGGASYSLRRCLTSKTCEGQNIKYRTCSNVDCPPDSGDFRAQQCSAHADVRYQGRYYEWLPVDNDPENPCALKCKAKGTDLVVELAPKVLDGTRCYTESLDMCISGACQIVGCDHELGSTAKEDNCGVCNGDGSSCRLVRGHYKSQHASGKTEDTVIVIPYGSRHVRLVLKGPDHLYLESKTLQGIKEELSLDGTNQYILQNTIIDFQKLSDKEILRIIGPLEADFTVKVHYASGTESVVQFIYYQPIIHRWRETDFFPCSVTCGGGYQLTSAECFDLRSNRVVVDQYCHYYPENVKPKPRLQECNMDPCPASDGYKQIMPYDLYHPLPRWESSPWTSCSTSCGGGVQSRSVSCVEEDMQGNITPTDEWKCLYATKTSIVQPCNTFDCPTWIAQEWSPCTVTCGQGLRYRVVLCIDHRGLHAGGCNPITKPHIKEDCLVPVPCYKPAEKLPVEAKPPWFKQAIELEEDTAISEEPTFIRGVWGPCSRSCGAGVQSRTVKCQVLLSFSQTVADLPDDECEGQKPPEMQPCYRTPCVGVRTEQESERIRNTATEQEELHDWEYDGFTECSEMCGGGVKEAVVICLNKQTREAADESECVSTKRPLQLVQACNTEPCPPRWELEAWSSCSATCGVGLQTRAVICTLKVSAHSNHTMRVNGEKCRHPKPSSVQACNRFDCPPMWDPQEWSQCSHTCGGGHQKRDVICKQRMADGSVLELPETFCPSSSLPTMQPCGQIDCPAQWVFSNWTQCSATCGEGTQRLLVVCRRMGLYGQYQTLIPEACASVPKPSTARSCSSEPCEKPFKPVAAKPDPAILTQRKVYIQWRKGPKLHFVVGGYAYLLPWTSVVLSCPTRNFRKGHVRWLKDGKPLLLLPHVSISHMGYIKIQQIRASDVGMYTCVAGQEQENFVLKLLGSKKTKLSGPETDVWLTDGGKNSAKTYQISSKEKEVLTFNRYDIVVQHLLNLKGLSLETYVSKELLDDDAVFDSQSPQVLVADMEKLDAVTRNLSGGLQGTQKEELITQLLEELTRKTSENNDSILDANEKQEFTTPKNISRGNDLRLVSQSTRQWKGPLRRPVIVQKFSRVYKSPHEIVTNAGSLVVVSRQATRMELKCEVHGNPTPVTIWTKEGMELKNDSRVGLMPDSSLYIEAPKETDFGFYTCHATNNLGSTKQSFHVQKAGSRCTVGRGKRNSTCSDKFQSSEGCSGQRCPYRWHVSSWSTCSVSCGGGLQRRNVTCLGAAKGRSCTGAGRKPTETKSCNTQLCVAWTTTLWGPCHGQCVGPQKALQNRHVFCQDKNRSRVDHRMCSRQPRPASYRNCTTDACALHWRVGPWTQCTATCGRHGFQSRHVTCMHQRSGKPAREFHCAWRPRPASWQRCNILSCGRGDCQDSTRYCEKVRQLELCALPQFKARCCRSCRDT